MADLNFDARNVEPRDDFDLMPAGWYKAEVISSEWKDTKDRTGRYVELVWKVTEGEYKNRQVWDRLNLQNTNSKAQEIAARTLSSICRSMNMMTVGDSSELHNKPVWVRIKVRKGRDNYDDSNEISGYRSFDDPPKSAGVSAPSQVVPKGATAAAESSGGGGGKPPWGPKR